MKIETLGLLARCVFVVMSLGMVFFAITLWVDSLPTGRVVLYTNTLGEARGELWMMVSVLAGLALLFFDLFWKFCEEVWYNE